MTPINYLSDNALDWNKALDKATTLEQLKALAKDWDYLCHDVVLIVEKMTPSQFRTFRTGLQQERKNIFAGVPFAEKYAAVLMPAVLFDVAQVEIKFKVPWGLAFIRMKEEGLLIEIDGHMEVKHLCEKSQETSGDTRTKGTS